MSSLQELYQSFLNSLESLWQRLLAFAPTFLSALLVLIIGLIISTLLGELARKIVTLARIDKFADNIGLTKELRNLGLKVNFAALAEWLVKWFFYIVTIFTVVDILNIEQLSSFLERLVLYLPNVLVAILILVVGLIAGRLLKNIVEGALESSAVAERISSFLGNLAKWSVFVFALMAALVQLGVAEGLIQILFTGFVLMLAIAGGLSFGLGGREHASRVLDRIEKEFGK